MKKFILSVFIALVTLPSMAQNSGLTVITPNGGETWITGCTVTIQWTMTATVILPVKIELYKSGTFYMTICSQTPSNTNSYAWTVPWSVMPSNAYKVKVSSLSNVALFDFSDNDFSILQGSIQVVSPNGGEYWQYGTTHLITWTDNICDNVRIELWKGGQFFSLITQSTPSTGSFPWAVTNTIPPGNDYRVKILAISSNTGTVTAIFDFSDNYFTIGGSGLTVLVPNGGEIWYIGGAYQVTWIDNVLEPARVELWKAGTLVTILANSVYSPFTWTISPNILPGNDYKIKVIALTSAGNFTKFDFSDNNFTINPGCNIQVTSPNGGEVWAKGTTHIITWFDNISYNVRIELWKGGAYHSLINASAPSTGTLYWAIPTTLPSGNNYKVKILALSNTAANTCFDFSDNYFSIIGPTPTNTGSLWDHVTVYPNPASDVLNVRFSEKPPLPVTVQLVAVTGSIIQQVTEEILPSDGTLRLDIPGVKPGPYVLAVRKDGEVIFRQLVVVE